MSSDTRVVGPCAGVGAHALRDSAKNAEGAASEALLQLVVDRTSAAIAMLDRDMHYLYVSKRWRSDYALGDADLRGASHYAVFPEINAAWREVHHRALAGESIHAECDRFERSDGSILWLRWDVVPWRDGTGAIGGIVIFTEDITATTEAEHAARKTAEWITQALASAHAGAWQWDVQTGENVWSEPIWHLFGLEKDNVHPSYAAWLEVVVPEDREPAARAAREAAKRGDDIAIEFRVRWPDGSIHHLISRAQRFWNDDHHSKYIGIVVDVTDQKQAEEVLRARELEHAVREVFERAAASERVTAERLRSAVENIEDAFVLFDGQDRLVLCNESYRHLLRHVLPRIEPGETYARLLEAWSHEVSTNDAERARYIVDRTESRRESPTAPFELRTRDGRVLRVKSSRTCEGGIASVVYDLTEDRRIAEELRRAHAAAEAGSAAKSEFLSSMSHELRTPLNAILGFTQLLQRDRIAPLSARQLARVDHILSGGEHLLRLIDDVLDLARIESGRVALSIEPVEVADILSSVKRSLVALEARHGIDVKVAPCPPDVPPVAADGTRFVQILLNLCSNALKYNRPDGTVDVEVTCPAPDRVRVAVRDTGVGIAASRQALLFTPFERAGQETGPIEGTGIGLVITRRLAAMMEGRVGFNSVAGEGSVFWVDLPATRAERNDAPLPSRVDAPPLSHRIPGDRLVLYVEDNPANVAFIRDVFESLDGVDLVTAPSAALGVALARQRRPQAILMDIHLAGELDGFDALRMLRATEAAAIPVIALSAAASDKDRTRGLKEGFRAYLTKPVAVDELLAALEPLLALNDACA
ncbi:MAG: PAS domain S-box protein [Polyangiaceae bacterium]